MRLLKASEFYSELVKGFDCSDKADIGVAFVTSDGLNYKRLGGSIIDFLNRKGRLRILSDLSHGISEPKAFHQILKWKDKFGELVQYRVYPSEQGTLFHPKVYIFSLQEDRDIKVILGSPNWSKQAMSSNIEIALRLEGVDYLEEIKEIKNFYEENWRKASLLELDSKIVELYSNFYKKKAKGDRKSVEKASRQWKILEGYLKELSTQESQIRKVQSLTPEIAYLLGLIAGRGKFNDKEKKINLIFHYGRYSEGYIQVESLKYQENEVLPLIPKSTIETLKQNLPFINSQNITTKENDLYNYEVQIDLSSNSQTYQAIREHFTNTETYEDFNVPQAISSSSLKSIIRAFIKGYGVIRGIITNETRAGPAEGLGRHRVYLTVSIKDLKLLFQLEELLKGKLAINAHPYRHPGRDPQLRIYAEDYYEQIGFGLSWRDALLQEAFQYNKSLSLSYNSSSQSKALASPK